MEKTINLKMLVSYLFQVENSNVFFVEEIPMLDLLCKSSDAILIGDIEIVSEGRIAFTVAINNVGTNYQVFDLKEISFLQDTKEISFTDRSTISQSWLGDFSDESDQEKVGNLIERLISENAELTQVA